MKLESTSEQLRTKVSSQKTIKWLAKYRNLCQSIWHVSLIQLSGESTLSLLLNTAKKRGKG